MTTEHIVSPKIYLLVSAALIVSTAVTVVVARIDLGPLNIVVAITIAVIQATLVVLFFMHLKYSHRLNWVFAAASILWLLLLIGLTMADVVARLAE